MLRPLENALGVANNVNKLSNFLSHMRCENTELRMFAHRVSYLVCRMPRGDLSQLTLVF